MKTPSKHSSITLVGELLFRVSGISGKAEIEEDEEVAVDTTAAESSRRALTEALGKERRDRVLAALYIIRQDSVAAVRVASIHIWKALVSNTPRTGELGRMYALFRSLIMAWEQSVTCSPCSSKKLSTFWQAQIPISGRYA